MAATAKSEPAASVKGKKGEGVVVVRFVDSKDTGDLKRVPADVHAVTVANRKGASKSFVIDQLPPALRNQLAAFALGKRMDIHVRNSAKEDGSDVVEIASQLFEALKAGKFYTRTEGKGGPGRTFDFDKWVEIMKITADKRKKPATAKNLADFRKKLESFSSPKDRSAYLNGLMKDPVVKVAKNEVEAREEKKKIGTTDYDALADAF